MKGEAMNGRVRTTQQNHRQQTGEQKLAAVLFLAFADLNKADAENHCSALEFLLEPEGRFAFWFDGVGVDAKIFQAKAKKSRCHHSRQSSRWTSSSTPEEAGLDAGRIGSAIRAHLRQDGTARDDTEYVRRGLPMPHFAPFGAQAARPKYAPGR